MVPTLLVSIFMLMPVAASAQYIPFNPGTGTGSIVPECSGESLGTNLGNECTFCDFMHLVQNLLNFVLLMAVVTAGALFAWAGWLYVIDGGNGSKVKQAKSIFLNVIIGLVLVIGAYTIVSTIMKTLAGGSFMDNWNTICTGYNSSAYSP